MEIFTVSSLDDELPRACLALLLQRFSELWDDPKLQRITYPLDEVCCCCDRLTCPGFSGHRLIERLASTRRQDEEIEVHGGADRLDSRGDGSRRGAGRGQAARSQRADDLHVEEAVRVVPAGRRSAAEEAGGGARPRDRGDERDRQKNGERAGPSRAGGLRGAPRTVAACLTVTDEWTKEGLAIEVDGRIRSGRVIVVLARLISERGARLYPRTDNGPEFVARALLKSMGDQKIQTALIDPGKPWQNGVAESFNGKLRDECLSLEWFLSRAQAKVVIEAWRSLYNEVRPHS